MKYKIDITGMHCSGCKNLITMSLEDAGFTAVVVDASKNSAEFESSENDKKVTSILDEVFKSLEEYSYTNLSAQA